MRLTDKVTKEAMKNVAMGRYKTTSFTLLRADYDLFKATCSKLGVKPSEALRAMVTTLIEENKDE